MGKRVRQCLTSALGLAVLAVIFGLDYVVFACSTINADATVSKSGIVLPPSPTEEPKDE